MNKYLVHYNRLVETEVNVSALEERCVLQTTVIHICKNPFTCLFSVHDTSVYHVCLMKPDDWRSIS